MPAGVLKIGRTTTPRMLGHGETTFFADGGGPCVVAFHGFGGSAAELRPLLERIAAAGYAVDAALLPGHGTHPADLQNLTFDDWLAASRDRVRAAVGRHGRAVLLGFSLGSLVALALAGESGESGQSGDAEGGSTGAPGGAPAVDGVVLLGNAVRLAPTTRVALAAYAKLGARMPDLYVRKPWAADLQDRTLLEVIVTYDRHPLRAATQVVLGGARVRSHIRRVTCPTLVLHGRHDRVCPWTNAPWVASHVGAKDVAVRVFDGSAHVVACDADRVEVADSVCAFLARVGGRPLPATG